MRLKFVCLTLAATSLTAFALPAAAQQSYDYGCNKVKNDRSAMGAVVGGLAGGIIGNQAAGRGARDEGTALGLVVGALAGSQIAKGDVRCPQTVYAAPNYSSNNTYDPYANQYANDRYNSTYSPPPAPDYNSYGYERNRPVEHARSRRGRDKNYYDSELARPSYGAYNDDYEYAGRECAGAKQITRLPDGSEIHRPVEACRTAYYGDWSVRD